MKCGCGGWDAVHTTFEEGRQTIDFLWDDGGRTRKVYGRKYFLDIHCTYKNDASSVKWNHFVLDAILDSAKAE